MVREWPEAEGVAGRSAEDGLGCGAEGVGVT